MDMVAAVDTVVIGGGNAVEMPSVLTDNVAQGSNFYRMASPDSAHPVYMNVSPEKSDLWSLE